MLPLALAWPAPCLRCRIVLPSPVSRHAGHPHALSCRHPHGGRFSRCTGRDGAARLHTGAPRMHGMAGRSGGRCAGRGRCSHAPGSLGSRLCRLRGRCGMAASGDTVCRIVFCAAAGGLCPVRRSRCRPGLCQGHPGPAHPCRPAPRICCACGCPCLAHGRRCRPAPGSHHSHPGSDCCRRGLPGQPHPAPACAGTDAGLRTPLGPLALPRGLAPASAGPLQRLAGLGR